MINARSAAALAILAIGTAHAAAPSPDQRRVFFGELHLHTRLSLDAWTYGTKAGPDEAYRFGRGETVMVPAVQVAREQKLPVTQDVPAKRAWPLDFMAVTDHSENLGTLVRLDDPNSSFAKSELGQRILKDPSSAMRARGSARGGSGSGAPELVDADAMREAWDLTVKAANDNYRPGRFTTFIAYEWSSLPGGKNLHRNVIFNSDHAPPPFNADQSNKPEDLWAWMESVRARGIEVLAIPHNGNASGGLMYDWNDSAGRPIDEAYAQRRALNEPLTEIVQIKGQSETVPALSPNDEFADFEIFDHLLARPKVKSDPHGSYVRDALGRGLVIQNRVGANPFKYGFVGGSDIHNALSASSENATAGGQFGLDPTTMLPQGEGAQKALGMLNEPVSAAKGLTEPDSDTVIVKERSSAGITGVWAEENTRDSIFAALKRKETFATSGNRIRVRMFGGWSFDPRFMKSRDWVARAYASGVPMGADLPVKPAQAGAPSFVLQAARDPEGANLDRIQIVKVWLEGGEYREQIFNVAMARSRKAGEPMLATVWQDPQFDPAKAAVYYARVLEIPTPRWSTLLAVANKLPIPADAPKMIQERAWSSPIWFTPSRR